jgi:hypothetical protein
MTDTTMPDRHYNAGQTLKSQTLQWRTDTTMTDRHYNDRHYNDGQTLQWRTDTTMTDRHYNDRHHNDRQTLQWQTDTTMMDGYYNDRHYNDQQRNTDLQKTRKQVKSEMSFTLYTTNVKLVQCLSQDAICQISEDHASIPWFRTWFENQMT